MKVEAERVSTVFNGVGSEGTTGYRYFSMISSFPRKRNPGFRVKKEISTILRGILAEGDAFQEPPPSVLIRLR